MPEVVAEYFGTTSKHEIEKKIYFIIQDFPDKRAFDIQTILSKIFTYFTKQG